MPIFQKDPRNLMEFYLSKLQEAGIAASPITDNNSYLGKLNATSREIDKTIKWVIEVEKNDFDYLFKIRDVIGTKAGNQKLEFVDYIVINKTRPQITENSGSKSNGLKKWFFSLVKSGYEKKTSFSIMKEKREVIDISWKGDVALAQRLDTDSTLREMIVRFCNINERFKMILVYYRPEFGYAGIRHNHSFGHYEPSKEMFEAMNIIARHIEAAWFGK